jgi:branched-chain amino acid transport system substrate-binding protein
VTRRTFGGCARAFGRILPAALAALAAAAALGALGALGACDNLSPRVSGTSSKDPGTGPIVIGHYASLTGSEATFGASDKNGLTLAVEERNARGGVHGRPIEVIRLDDASKAAEAGTAVTRLITEYHVVAVVGEVSSGLSLAGGAVAQSYRVPMVVPSSTNERVTQVGNMISRVCFIDGFQGYVVAKFAHDHLHATRVGILYDQQQAYSKGLAREFDRAFRALGGTITTRQAYTGGDINLSAQLQSLKDTDPQAIFLPGYYNDAGNISIQARKLGITVPILGGDGWDSERLAEIGGAAMEGNYYSNHYSFEESRPAVKGFVERFQHRFGFIPDGLTALGYDAGQVLFDAMDRAKSLDGDDLAAAIASTKGFPGVTGAITLDEHRNPVKSAVMLVIKHGERRYAATIDPPAAPLPEVPDAEDAGAGPAGAAGATGAGAGKLLQTVVDTLALGALYALIALGYTLVYGVLRFINFAHADVFTFGAWSSFVLANWLGFASAPSWLGLPVVLALAMILSAALGVTIERLAYRPLRNAPRLNALITSIGVSLLLQNTGILPWAFGPNPQHMPALITDRSLAAVAGVHLRLVDTVVLVLAVGLVAALELLVYRTRLGRAMRAVSFDARVASLMGINIGIVITIAFAIGSALAAAGGLLYGLKYESLQITSHSTWVLLGLTAFVSAVVGGIGDVRGAAVGALLIAAVQQFGAAYLSTQLRDVYVFTVLIVVLLVKPAGLLGRTRVEKV